MNQQIPPPSGERDLRSFGRRRGRKLSPRQATLMAELLPAVAIDLSRPAQFDGLFDAAMHALAGVRPSDLARLRRDGSDPMLLPRTCQRSDPPILPASGGTGQTPISEVWLEIGFGGGEHLIWQAEHNAHVGIIGCEPFEDGVVKVLTAIDDKCLRNILLLPDDARPLLRWLPPASIARAFVLFPDPWPKRKHVKRRLVNPSTLDLLARVLKPGAELRIGTDIGDYVRTLLIAIHAHPAFAWGAASPRDWRQRPADWPPTRYEQKAIREGRRGYFFRFQRRDT